MPFNVALTGIRAATADLEVTGNNVANASTTGFKKSRAEFGDLYANGFLNGGTTQIGDGVRVQNIRQDFGQGNLTFTENNLDLAINGQGFFVLDNAGERRYSRAGAFGVDREGFVVNNSGMRLQGFGANQDGVIGGVLGNLQIDNSNLAPRRSTAVNTQLNLDSRESVLAQRGTELTTSGSESGRALALPAVPANGVNAQTVTFSLADGSSFPVSYPAGSSASGIADILNSVEGVNASATTTAQIPAAGFVTNANTTVTINGVNFSGAHTPTSLANAINSAPGLSGISASVVDAGGPGERMVLTQNRGNDLQFGFSSTDGTGGFSVQGQDGSPLVPLTNGGSAAVVGSVNLVMDEGVTISGLSSADGMFQTGELTGAPFVNNLFDPLDENTYNHATTTTVYDSLGNAHVLNMYFVKEQPNAGAGLNRWTLYAQIDGQDVGDPVVPGGAATRADYNIVFNSDGSVNDTLSDPVLISNWIPRDATGAPNGADGPLNVGAGGTLPVADPPSSSNFEIRLNNITQFGSAFSVNDMQQNGFTTGRLTGLDVNNDGIIFARYTNGESQVLGQVALANFNDQAGLAAVGETSWVETYRSGAPIIGMPGTATLGNVRSSSLEDSNVDLSEQLVNLITAQRNYQANAKTIETANAVTQTIINLR